MIKNIKLHASSRKLQGEISPKVILFSVLLFLLGSASVIGQSKKVKKLDKYLTESMKTWNVPGMSVVVIEDGKNVLSKGYGLANTTTGTKVDPNTLFAIASNSKAYTASSIAILVEEGKMNWDDKVRDHLPWFELYDPYVSNNMTIEDLLCHRSGLATFSGDLIWYGSKYSREEIVQRARHLKPTSGFRSTYGYQNIMFLSAGLVVEKVSGMSWDDFVKEHFFLPLEMNRTATTTRGLDKISNVAAPHNEVEGKNIPIQWVNWDNIGPAGSIISSASDVSKWLKMQLGQGILDGDTIFSRKQWNNMTEMRTPQRLSLGSKDFMSERTMRGYALGWAVMIYRGHKVVMHGGGYDGMISQTFFLPDDGIAGAILTNNITSAAWVYMHDIIDHMLGEVDEESWTDKVYPLVLEGQEADKKAEEELEASRVKNSKASLPLKSYAGTYGGDLYGDCIVEVDGDRLKFQFEPTPLFHGYMDHWHYDTFRLSWGEQMMLPKGMVQFIIGVDGKVEEMRIDVPNPDFDFTELEFMKK